MSAYLLWPLSFLLALVLFSLAVFIHELGHFLAARWLGLRADVFSIGFGPALWKRTVRGTEIRISAIPFGGYVSLPQLDPEGMKGIQGEHGEETLPPAAPWKRVIVAFAGPFGNLVLAFVCAVAIACFAPEDATGASTTVGYVETDSAADRAGLRVGDRILAVNGNAVRSWSDFLVESYLGGDTNATVTLAIERAGEPLELAATLDTRLSPEESIYVIGGVHPGPLSLGVGSVVPDSPADKAGLRRGDVILTIDGKPFERIEQLTDRANPRDSVTLAVRTLTEPTADPREVTLVPEVLPALPGEVDPQPRLGIVVGMFGQGRFQWMAERGVWAQLRADAMGVFRVLEALCAPKAEGEAGRAASGLGGPIMIFGLFVQVVQTGLWASLGFLRLICVNLALLNLLPLPVLDGGHILFALYAMIFRREAPAKVINILTNVFVWVLIGLFVILIYRDSMRMIVPFFDSLIAGLR